MWCVCDMTVQCFFFSSSVNKVQLLHVVNLNVFSCLTFQAFNFWSKIYFMAPLLKWYVYSLLRELFTSTVLFGTFIAYSYHSRVKCRSFFFFFLWSVHFDHLDDHISLNLAESIGFIDSWITHRIRPFSSRRCNKTD